ncbi:MAG: hypothetical protein EB127_24085 [Alphaproteobacteria bacterium]|nr:hypothetical protein [Alphaproteobacteria bacterium]
MPLRILEVGRQFRLGTSHVYPPFKNGRYMEEYCYEVLMAKKEEIQTNIVYIPIFWTNLQNHAGFASMKSKYQLLLNHAVKAFPATTRYMTIVQHDDGPQLQLPKDTIIFGACTGTIPLPLIYEDTTHRLLAEPRCPKTQLASFVGTLTTHVIREELFRHLNKPDIVWNGKRVWEVAVQKQDAELFIKETLQSRFCLAPRGYGRSSFRFFEAMLLDTVPVYIWDDIEWLPYQDILDYSTFSISISKKDIPNLYNILSSISNETYETMVENIKKNRYWFELQGMVDYMIQRLSV